MSLCIPYYTYFFTLNDKISYHRFHRRRLSYSYGIPSLFFLIRFVIIYVPDWIGEILAKKIRQVYYYYYYWDLHIILYVNISIIVQTWISDYFFFILLYLYNMYIVDSCVLC